jgi:hypothetical protein
MAAAWYNGKFGTLPWVPDFGGGGGGAAPAFDPSLYMDMWHDPRYGNTPDGSNRVASYTDTITGGTKTYTQATDLKKPTIVAGIYGGGTLPALRFTAASAQLMQLGASYVCPTFTMIQVVRYRSAARMMLWGRNNEGGIFEAGDNAIMPEIWAGGGNFAGFNEIYALNTSYLYVIQGKASPPNATWTRYNSAGVATVMPLNGSGGAWTDMNHFYLGSRSGSSMFANADYGPGGLALSTLSAAEIDYMVDGIINEEGWLA